MRRAVSRIIPNKLRSLDNESATANPQHKRVYGISPSQSRDNNNNNNGHNNGMTSNSSVAGHLSLSSPFRIDFNSVSDFYIVLDNPHNSWLPGDEISGQIILISKKNLANIIITLSLVGFVKINASSHSKLRPVRHNLFNHTIKIYGDNSNPSTPTNTNNDQEFSNGLFKGEHRFPFIVKLPNKRIFTSIDFGKGSITYLLRASMGDIHSINNSHESASNSHTNGASAFGDSSVNNTSSGFFSKTKNLKLLNNSNYTTEKLINLINPIDINTLPNPKPKRLIIKDPRYNHRKLSRTQSSNSTINTFNTYSTFSSNNSDSNDTHSQHEGTNTQNHSDSQIPGSQSHETETIPNQTTEEQSQSQSHAFENAQGRPLATNSESTPNTPSNVDDDMISNQKENYFHNNANSNVSYDCKPETIKVSLSIPKKGYLRGELIPIKLNINHLRKVQDVNGIIVTFVRVCRLDNGPEGLFDSFRKDLAQSVIPLYVDPNTFTSEINTSIRIPADSFPTISGCPLVSFQYFVEVLVNLSGKTVVLDDNLPKSSVGSDNGHQSPIIDFPNSNGGNMNNSNTNAANSELDSSGKNISDSLNDFKLQFNYLSSVTDFNQKERSTFINTDKYKRMKKFLQLTSEIVIGTHRLTSEQENLMAMDMHNMNSPVSRRSSASDGSPGGIQVSNSFTSLSQYPSSPHTQQFHALNHYHNLASPGTGVGSSSQTNHINVIPESREIDSFNRTPYYPGSAAATTGDGSDSQPPTIPAYHEVHNEIDLLPMPNRPQMSEKEQLRAHESSLLPSEPGVGTTGSESHESVSPVGNDSDILGRNDENNMKNVSDNVSQPQDQEMYHQPEEEPRMSASAGDNHTQFNFFILQNSSSTINNMDLNDDQYNNLDYVPNYEGSSNDQLVPHGGNMNDRDQNNQSRQQ